MLYAAVVGAVCSGGAWLAERAATSAGRPVRWVWACALALSLALPGAAVWRAAHDAAAQRTDAAGALHERLDPALLFGRRGARPGMNERPLWQRALLALPGRVMAPAGWSAFDGGLLAVWTVLTMAALARMGAAAAATRRIAGAWPRRVVLGVQVRVSDDLGPAVVGAWRAEIVLPRWALDDARLPLMLGHEREHVGAHDARLLLASTVAAALLPWSPAAWWAVRRLRAAVEVDCDRRVLARYGARVDGASQARGRDTADAGVVRRYGALLLDVAARPQPVAPALMLGGTPTLLRRRIETMLSDRSRAPRRAIVPALAAIAVVAVACEIPKPTGPAPASRVPLTSITSVDSAVAPPTGPRATIGAVRDVIASRLPDLLTARTNRTQNVWVVQRADGTIERVAHTDAGTQPHALDTAVARTTTQANPLATLDSQAIASVEVLRIAPGRVARDSVNVVWVVRRPDADPTVSARAMTPRRAATVASRGGHAVGAPASIDSMLVVVDGRVAGRGHAVVDAVSPDSIASVDVLKGPLATERYGDAGRLGVIVLTTKKPAGQ